MSQNYSLHFFLKKPKYYKGGAKAVYMRITVNNSIAKEASVGRMCEPKDWISSFNRAKGTSEPARTLNSYLDAIDRKVEQIHTNLKKLAMEITAETIMNKYLGKEERAKFLMEIFAHHNEKMEASIGKGFKANTLKGYKSSVIHLTAYLQKDYNGKDIDIRKIDHAFIIGYEFYLRTEKEISDVSVAKYMKHFRKIINLCLAHRWIEHSPFVFYKNKAKAKDKEFLTKEELNEIANKEFGIERLERVKNIFLFSCYTGLSYADVKKLTRSEIKKGNDGKLWIFTNREKNEIASNVPLLAVPKTIMNKYEDHPDCKLKGMVLPVLSNQKMNSYLKEIADHCGISKILTFHIARHTFATTITLSNNVPIETVSKMLGAYTNKFDPLSPILN